VKYVIAPVGSFAPAELAEHDLTTVYTDRTTEIIRMPHPVPYASAPGCTVRALSRDEFEISCAHTARLTRLELSFPGWTATVSGARAGIAEHGIFQSIRVPAGDHTVRFRYWPDGLTPSLYATAVALAVLIALAAMGAGARLPVRPRDRREVATPGRPPPSS
jgi:hypothetical protein